MNPNNSGATEALALIASDIGYFTEAAMQVKWQIVGPDQPKGVRRASPGSHYGHRTPRYDFTGSTDFFDARGCAFVYACLSAAVLTCV